MKKQELISKKQSLEQEISLLRFLLSIEHRREVRTRIEIYLEQIEREILELLT